MGRRRKDRELYWRSVLERQADSGLSVAQFCRQESVSAPSLYAWKRKLQQQEAGSAAIDSQGAETAPWGAQLVPVRIESGSSPVPVRIALPQGASIDAPSGIDRSALVELLGALREAQLC